MSYIVSEKEPFEINLMPQSVTEEVLQNLRTLLATPKFSVPLDRDLGLECGFIDKPFGAVQSLLVGEITDAVEKYEPRAEIIDIRIESGNMEGKLVTILEVEIRDG
ncbi:hypothetical protein FACS18949_13520 [Clostridia bacterium]|nr:hypothetical protein FACS189425_06310 [Clostridia bacterium]GHV35472.1 hypothetical protein FACS18949_13520 [Clostridia bacterium]